MKRKPIQDQVAVVVGATSGIGRQAALEFGRRGAKVVVAGRSQPELERLAAEIRREGGEALPVVAEVSDYEQVKAIADRAVSTFGRIDTWVHTAAVSLYATVESTAPEEFRRVVDVNLMGQVYGAMAALPYLKAGGGGALIHISSVEGRRSFPLQSAYAASKKGLNGFLGALRMELEHEGSPVSVTTIMPASINTPFFDKALTRLGVKPAPVPPVYEPSLVADAILYAAEHPVRDLIVGGAGKSVSLLERLSPRLADKLLTAPTIKLQRSDEPKSAQAPNNLYHHLEGFDRVEGSFSQEAKPFSLYTWLRTHPVANWAVMATVVGTTAFVSVRALRARSQANLSLPSRVGRTVKGAALVKGASRGVKKVLPHRPSRGEMAILAVNRLSRRLLRRETPLERVGRIVRERINEVI